ncbi:MAG TPA: hypothetical protein VIM64_13405, partial [Puia sp.]
MRQIFTSATLYLVSVLCLPACKLMPKDTPASSTIENNKEFAQYLNDYFEERMRLLPLEATQNGDSRYNDLLPADFADSYRDSLKNFFTRFRNGLSKWDRSKLSAEDG